MSNNAVKDFILPDFTHADAGQGKGSPKKDSPPQAARGDGVETKSAAVFDEDFLNIKRENARDASLFETPFVTEKDITQLLKKAEKEAEELMERAGNEVARIEKEAYEKGYEAGKELGLRESREEGEKKLVPCIEAFGKSLKELAACRAVTYKNCEAELIELFNTLSQRVIHRELSQSHEFLRDVIREAMHAILNQERITVRLNSKDLEYAEGFKADLLAEMGHIKSVALKKDDSVTRGGCMIETNFGGVDGSVETKIREIAKVLTQEKPQKEEYETPLKEPEEPSPDA